MHLAPGQGQITLCGHNPDVNNNNNNNKTSHLAHLLQASKISLKSEFIHYFSCFYTCTCA